MLRLIALLLAGAWIILAGVAMAQDQEGESVGEPMDQAPVEMPQPEMQVPQEVLEFLQDRRPASALSDEELGQRVKQARQLLKMNGLSPQSRRDIKAVSEELRAERQTRMAAAQNSGPDVQQGKAADAESEPVPAPSEMPAETNGEAVEAAPAEPVESAPQVPPEVAAFLADARPPAELSVKELGQRSKQARDLLAIKGLDPATQQELRAIAKRLRSERAARQQSPETSPGSEQVEIQPEAPSQNDSATNQTLTEQPETQAGGEVAPAPPEIENKARAIIADDVSAERLSDEQLSDRLKEMRAVLEEPGLSKKEQRALRKRLKADREVLRSRMASADPKAEVPQPGAEPIPGTPRQETQMDMDWPTQEVLRDRRAPDTLQTGQLRRRLSVYRDAMGNNQYPQEERDSWRSGYERDRSELRRRMFDERRERQTYWDEQRRDGKLDINVDIAVEQEGPPPAEIWADEVEDEEIEGQLLAPPRRKIQQRYSIEDFEDEPDLREVMPGVEIDTIRFGFNEAFVREEEIDNLDRIAEAIEKILAARPGEVFLIEGHTDAVGSDAYNLPLSRQRAQAVKEALTTYFVIPPQNLETIGYGERYLKIPTEEPEQENRRVALRRVTPLVGELGE